jgi:hypothetical protein
MVETQGEFESDIQDLIKEMCDFIFILYECGKQERICLLRRKAISITEMIKQASEFMMDHLSKRSLSACVNVTKVCIS